MPSSATQTVSCVTFCSRESAAKVSQGTPSLTVSAIQVSWKLIRSSEAH